MNRPPTVWDSPQFVLIPDEQTRTYGNVSNVLVYEDDTGHIKEYPIVVPTGLFTMMRQIMRVEPTDDAFLYITQEGEWYVFGIAWSITEFTDLWLYSETSLLSFLR